MNDPHRRFPAGRPWRTGRRRDVYIAGLSRVHCFNILARSDTHAGRSWVGSNSRIPWISIWKPNAPCEDIKPGVPDANREYQLVEQIFFVQWVLQQSGPMTVVV